MNVLNGDIVNNMRKIKIKQYAPEIGLQNLTIALVPTMVRNPSFYLFNAMNLALRNQALPDKILQKWSKFVIGNSDHFLGFDFRNQVSDDLPSKVVVQLEFPFVNYLYYRYNRTLARLLINISDVPDGDPVPS